jgi:type IV secretion/conjugal transfer VirB4 family ATPase
MLNLKEYRSRPDRLSDYLPWAMFIAPGVMLNKDGSLMRVLSFRGPDLDSSTTEELMSVRARLNNALRRFGSGWCIHLEACRRQSSAYEGQDFPDPTSWIMDHERSLLFNAEGQTFETHYYLTLTYLPPEDAVSKAASIMIENAVDSGQGYDDHLTYFDNLTINVANILKSFMPYVSLLNDEELLTYLHSCVSSKNQTIKVPDVPFYLDSMITDEPLVGGLYPRLGENYMRTIAIRAFVSSTTPGLLDALNRLPMEYRWCSRYIPLDKQEATKTLTKIRKNWFAKRKSVMTMLKEGLTKSPSALEDADALNKAADADMALQELGEDLCNFGYFTPTVTVWDKDPDEVTKKVRDIQMVLDSLGFVSGVEDVNSVEAWMGSLPGQAYADIRRPLVSSLNLCDMIPMSSIWAGPERNKHLDGPVLMRTHTVGSTPFRFSNHMGDVGHQMIIGPTGAGKSTFLALFTAQFLRYKDAQVYIFDKGASSRAMTFGVGGDFFDLGKKGHGLAFQPFREIDDENERIWAQEWLIDILDFEGIEITPELKNEVWDTLSNMAAAPTEERTFTILRSLIQDNDVRDALRSYTLDGPYGHMLDASENTFAESNWQAFEMEELMNTQAVLIPVLMYLFHRLEKRFTGPPTLLVLDEAWLFLDHGTFSAKIREWLKVLRKKNVSVIFATQSIADVSTSKIATALIESCPSRIFLPNSKAMEPETQKFYKKFGCNERQIQILATATPKMDYYYQSQVGNRLFSLGLTPLSLVFCGSSGPDDQKQITEIMQRYGKAGFAEGFLRAKGFAAAAEEVRKWWERHNKDDSAKAIIKTSKLSRVHVDKELDLLDDSEAQDLLDESFDDTIEETSNEASVSGHNLGKQEKVPDSLDIKETEADLDIDALETGGNKD